MPISRKKSCIHCRRAKARCNLANTCSRCLDRGLQCSYSSSSSTDFSAPPSNMPRLMGEVLGRGAEGYSSAGDEVGDMYAFNLMASEPVGLVLEDPEGPTHDWSGERHPCSVADPIMPGPLGVMLGQSSRPSSSGLFFDDGHFLPAQDFDPENNKGTVVIYGQVYHNILSLRDSKDTPALLTTRFILGQVKAYPTMLIRDQLPPFIYPSCVLSGQLPQSCILNGVHQCLTPPLATCAAMIRIWEASTPATMELVWRSIYAEMKRLGDEYQQYDEDELLGAFQAIVVYMLLQIQDLQHMQPNGLVSMMMTFPKIARRVSKSKSGSYLRNLFTSPNLTQRLWVFNESIRRYDLYFISPILLRCADERRTMAVLYIVDSTLRDRLIEHHEPIHCGGSDSIPLPGPRYLWDYNIREAWAFRLDRFRASDRGREPELTFGDLQKSGEGDEAHAHGLARWCEDADELGGLLRMSALLA